MRLRSNIIAIAIAVIALAGCGGKSEEQQAHDAAAAFFKAEHERDYGKVCDLLSQSAQRQLKLAAKGDCETVLTKAARGQTGGAVGTVGEVRVANDRASVFATVTRPGKAPETIQVLLVKESGGWKVSSRL